MQSMKPQSNIQCAHCGHGWHTDSKAKNATCPSCQLKTRKPQYAMNAQDQKWFHLEQDAEPETRKTSKVVPLDYATRRAQLEQEFIKRFSRNWTSEGGSIRPVGLKRMTIRGLERYVNIAKMPLREVNQECQR